MMLRYDVLIGAFVGGLLSGDTIYEDRYRKRKKNGKYGKYLDLRMKDINLQIYI